MSFLRNNPAFKQRRQELRRNQTDAEKIFWLKIRNRQFHGLKFFRQYSIGPYILDFYCPEVKFAVELDGGQHNELMGREYDAARSEYLKECGVTVLRFWNHEVLFDIQAVLSKLEKEIYHPQISQNHNAPSPPLISRGGTKQ
jgi:very-short-patch-repair endonuclease